MRLLVFEPYASGHHMRYLKHIAKGALRRGWSVCHAIAPESLNHPAYREFNREFDGRLQTVVMPQRAESRSSSPFAVGGDQFQSWIACRATLRRMAPTERPDLIYMSNLDYCTVPLALFGSPFGRTPFCGMLLNVNFHHRAMGVRGRWSWREKSKEFLVRRTLATPGLKALLTLDELLPQYARSRRIAGMDKLYYVPELPTLADCGPGAKTRADFGISDDQCAVLLFGTLGLRKGVSQLVRAAVDPACPPSVVVVLAGPQDDAVRALLKGDEASSLRSSGRLIEAPGYHSLADAAAIFRACDVAWLGYWGFYNMSAVLLQAALAGLPVIACKDGLVGWHASTSGLGEVVEITEHNEVVGALNSLANDRPKRAAFSGNCTAFASRYTAEKFEDAICSALAASSGRP